MRWLAVIFALSCTLWLSIGCATARHGTPEHPYVISTMGGDTALVDGELITVDRLPSHLDAEGAHEDASIVIRGTPKTNYADLQRIMRVLNQAQYRNVAIRTAH